MKTKIFSLAFGGRGVGKVDGKVCFVRGALPGEEVFFNIEKETSKYIEGELSKIITSSSDRVEPICKYYSECGGCELQHISYEKEVIYKKEQLTELIKRIAGKKDFECFDMIPSPDPYHYRSSITLHKKGNKYGYFSRGTRNLIEIDSCPITEEPLNEVLAQLIVSEKNDDLTLKSDCNGNITSSIVPGKGIYIDKYRDIDMYFSSKVFSQANRYIAEKIAITLEDWIGEAGNGAAFFDLYCGVGFFSFLLKNDFASRTGIESGRIAVECAKLSLKKNRLKDTVFHCGDAENVFFDIFKDRKREKNFLLIDPPRKGSDRAFLEKASEVTDISKIYYLSCDPARLARDMKIITENSKWGLGKVQPFDMFPRTKHIETLVEFIKM